MPTPTPEAWTKEFDEELKSSGGLASAINPMGLQVGQIKSFIRSLLLSERQRIVEKVVGLKDRGFSSGKERGRERGSSSSMERGRSSGSVQDVPPSSQAAPCVQITNRRV